MPASTDAFLVVAADARADRTGARPSRAVVARRRWIFELNPTVVRFLDGVERLRRFLW
jgi:hypothetical protein